MRASRTLFTLASVALLAACGGPGENATVPVAEPAGASFVNIGDHVVISARNLPTSFRLMRHVNIKLCVAKIAQCLTFRCCLPRRL